MGYRTKKSSLETVEEYLTKKKVFDEKDQKTIIDRYNFKNTKEIFTNTVIDLETKEILSGYIADGILCEEFSQKDYYDSDEY